MIHDVTTWRRLLSLHATPADKAGQIMSALNGYPSKSNWQETDKGNLANAIAALQVSEPAEVPMVKLHVEELFEAAHRFETDVRHAIAQREYSKIDTARAHFILWCELHGLDLDFKDPSA